MMDARYQALARTLLEHSLEIRPGQKVLIRFDTLGAEFAEVLGEQAVRVGAIPVFAYSSKNVEGVLMAEGKPDQLEYVHPSVISQTECDAQVLIEAPVDDNTPRPTQESAQARWNALQPWRDRVMPIRYVVTSLPTEQLARTMGMGLAECEDLVLRSSLDVNYGAIVRQADDLQKMFATGRHVHITAPGTSLRFTIGRPWVTSHGLRNMPDGEVFTAPIPESVHGHVSFPGDSYWGGTPISNTKLTLRHGDVTQADATNNQDMLRRIVAYDAGSKRFGEFGIGLNPFVTTPCGNAAFDEKIQGTIHLALGRAYPNCGGGNDSAIHWDLVLDLRRGGEIRLDGRLICKDGIWVGLENLIPAEAAD